MIEERPRDTVLDLVRHSGLNAIAEECHRLAAARGKYDEPWSLEAGVNQIIAELLEWFGASVYASSRGGLGRDRSDQEAGDSLHALLSVMARVGIDVEQVLRDAMERNRRRAEEGL